MTNSQRALLLSACAALTLMVPASGLAGPIANVAAPPAAAPTPTTPTLLPEEQATGAVLIEPAPGTAVEATVVPNDCDNKKVCGFVVRANGQNTATKVKVTAGTNAKQSRAARPTVEPINGAEVSDVVVESLPTKSALASKSLLIKYWQWNDDHICSNLGCWAFELQLNSKSYFDGTYAWGSRSRYGYAGYANINGTKGTGVSMSSSSGFSGDPSRADLYAYNHTFVNGVIRGVGFSRTYYLHRHSTGDGRSWLVGG